jgi:VanZ family protein
VGRPNRITSYTRGDATRRQITRWAAVVIWAAVIFHLSSLSRLPPFVATWSLTALAHFVEYAVLTLLLIRALAAHRLARSRALWIAVVLAIAYGVSDEYHQSFVPNRRPSRLDLVVDSLGVLAASLLAVSTYARREPGVQ